VTDRKLTVLGIGFDGRFLLHVLPHRYVRIRHFGLLANRNRQDNIALCRKILGDIKTVIKDENSKPESWQGQLLRICGIDVTICPVGQKGGLFRAAILLPYRCNSPPELLRLFEERISILQNCLFGAFVQRTGCGCPIALHPPGRQTLCVVSMPLTRLICEVLR
jgi:hypothetical protein